MDDLLAQANREMRRWATDHSDRAAWDARALIERISRAGDGDLALRVGERALEVWPDFEPIRHAVAWALYRRDITPVRSAIDDRRVRDRAKAALGRIAELTAADPYGRYSPWPLSVLMVARASLGRWPNAALELLRRLDPDRLGTAGTADQPGPRAQWYLATSKALEKLGRWEELSTLCEEALGAAGLRGSAVGWIRRRSALALLELGRPEQSVAILEQLRRQLPDWWLDADLARALAATGRNAEALEAARSALAKAGKLPAKWRVVALVAELLAERNPSLAAQHVRLARALRHEQGWPADDQLEHTARSLGVDGPPTRPPMNDLVRFWSEDSAHDRRSGVVKALLPGGQSGFITADDGTDVYFAHPRNSPAPPPPPGTPVTFRLVQGFDRKKNRPSLRAVAVKPQPTA